MNDAFENRIREQRMRPVPAGWRSKILAAANAAATKPDITVAADDSTSFWSSLFGRFPLTWGALAGVWAVLAAVNLLLANQEGTTGTQALTGTTEPFTVWQLQRAELRQLARGDGAETDDAPSAQPPPPARPRSEQHRDDGFGNHMATEANWPMV